MPTHGGASAGKAAGGFVCAWCVPAAGQPLSGAGGKKTGKPAGFAVFWGGWAGFCPIDAFARAWGGEPGRAKGDAAGVAGEDKLSKAGA